MLFPCLDDRQHVGGRNGPDWAIADRRKYVLIESESDMAGVSGGPVRTTFREPIFGHCLERVFALRDRHGARLGAMLARINPLLDQLARFVSGGSGSL